ncbi:MAG: hypothetical protein HY767_01590 [Candidatus Omnitrophica bacterium]|nr:hypothetical protein [Candidatus Omnitrophota bacterium]
MAQREAGVEEPEEGTPAAQAQATMASLFGRGAKMPSIPRAGGTIALPAFDDSSMTIDEGSLRAAERQKSIAQRATINDQRNG